MQRRRRRPGCADLGARTAAEYAPGSLAVVHPVRTGKTAPPGTHLPDGPEVRNRHPRALTSEGPIGAAPDKGRRCSSSRRLPTWCSRAMHLSAYVPSAAETVEGETASVELGGPDADDTHTGYVDGKPVFCSENGSHVWTDARIRAGHDQSGFGRLRRTARGCRRTGAAVRGGHAIDATLGLGRSVDRSRHSDR